MAGATESFNFYDVYGYLFPGVALTLLVAAPVWYYHHPPAENFGLGSVLAATIAAYIAGHLLQSVAVAAMPSSVRVRQPSGPEGDHQPPDSVHDRQPSDIMLDRDDKTFTLELKTQVAAAVQNVFCIDVNDADNSKGKRQDAFFQCRDALVASKRASYVEQFEGMYTLMRGLSAALLLGAAYFAGWSLAFSHGHCVGVVKSIVLWMGLVGGLAATIAGEMSVEPAARQAAAKCILGGLMLVLAATGHTFGQDVKMTTSEAGAFAAAGVLAFMLFLRCHGAYMVFAREYAKAVWRGFVALRKMPGEKGELLEPCAKV